MLSSLFLNNPFEKQTSPLKHSYWENRRREEQARKQQAFMEPTTPAFSQAFSSFLANPAEDTFSLTPLPLFEPESPLEPPMAGSYFVPDAIADLLPSHPELDAGREPEPAVPSFQPFLADVFGLVNVPFRSQDQPADEGTAFAAESSRAVPETSKQRPQPAFPDLASIRIQPPRQAKDEHLLSILPPSLSLDLASQLLLLGGTVEEPLSPRAADTKAGYKTRHQSRLTMTQGSGLPACQSFGQSPLTSDTVRADFIALLQAESPLLSEQAPAEPVNKRAELKVKKAMMLQDYANGQTDGQTLMTTYQLTPRQLRTWVLEFRRQQEANGLHYPKLEWSRQKHAESGIKRKEETSEVTLDSDYQPVQREASKKSRKRLAFQNPQNSNNPFFRMRGEGGRFASRDDVQVPSAGEASQGGA